MNGLWIYTQLICDWRTEWAIQVSSRGNIPKREEDEKR